MKRTRITLFLSAVTVVLTLAGCNNPLTTSPSKKPQTATEDADSQPMVGVTKANSDGTYSLEFTLPEKSGVQASRLLVNYENSATLQADINYYQLVAVDDTASDQIWASVTAQASGVLRVEVNPTSTYHLLLLHGHKNNPADANETPFLLGSGYIKYRIKAEKDTEAIIIRMVPMLVDATIVTAGAVDATSAWDMTRNIAWVKNENFDVTIKLRSRDATQDGASASHGNALWPLLLAQARGTEAVWNTFKADMPAAITDKASPQYASTKNGTDGAPWTGSYWTYDGEQGGGGHTEFSDPAERP